MENIVVDCGKADCRDFKSGKDDCFLCPPFFSLYHPVGSGMSLELTIPSHCTATPAPADSVPEQVKTIIEPCREATKRWKAAEAEAKAKGDKARQKAIRAVISNYLCTISPAKSVELVDPFSAEIGQLNQIGRGKGLIR